MTSVLDNETHALNASLHCASCHKYEERLKPVVLLTTAVRFAVFY